jgi:hypothetical protein
MEVYKTIGTDDTPAVIMDTVQGVFEISGRSLPEDVNKFYNPILDWLDLYFKTPNVKTVFCFKLTYFNTASSKMLLDILMHLEEFKKKGKEISVLWYYPEDDDDMMEAGNEYAELVELPFEKIAYNLNKSDL